MPSLGSLGKYLLNPFTGMDNQSMPLNDDIQGGVPIQSPTEIEQNISQSSSIPPKQSNPTSELLDLLSQLTR